MERRHQRHIESVKEAHASEPELSAELSELFSRLRQCASDATDSDPASELVGGMERVAATTLHAALLECLDAHGATEESSHIWSDEAAPITLRVPACMPGSTPIGGGTGTDEAPPVAHGAAGSMGTGGDSWGQLVIAPLYLICMLRVPYCDDIMLCEKSYILVE